MKIIEVGCYVRCINPAKYITLNNADVYQITKMLGHSVWLSNGCPYSYSADDFIRDETKNNQ